MKSLTKSEVERAIANPSWDLGNEALYKLCREYPLHRSPQEIIAKIWLIGRSYAAAIERRKSGHSGAKGDLFYENHVVPQIVESQIDHWIGSLGASSSIGDALEAHLSLTSLFCKISGQNNRSLASKYLHFHKPSLFFIYDSRAATAIRQVTPAARKMLPTLSSPEADSAYLSFCRRCVWWQQELESQHGRKLNPREIDKLLLAIADKRI